MDRLPYDLVNLVSLHLPLSDLLALSSTCKYLNSTLQCYRIWRSAISRLLVTTPHHTLSHRLRSLPTPDLRKAATRAVALDAKLRLPESSPRRVRELLCNQDVAGIKFIPGGEHVVVLLEQTLELWCATEGTPLARVDLPGPPWRGNYTLYNFEVSLSVTGEVFVLIHAYVHHGLFLVCVYSVNVEGRAFKLLRNLSNVTIAQCAIWDNLLIYLASDINDETGCFAHVQLLSSSDELCAPPVKTVIRIPVQLDWIFHNMIALLDHHSLVCYTNGSIHVFEIPPLGLCLGKDARLATVAPIFTHKLASSEDAAPSIVTPSNPRIPHMSRVHFTHEGLLYALTRTADQIHMREMALPLPRPVPSGDDLPPNFALWTFCTGQRWFFRWEYTPAHRHVILDVYRVRASSDQCVEPVTERFADGSVPTSDTTEKCEVGIAGRCVIAWENPACSLSFDEASGRVCALDLYGKLGPRAIIADLLG